MAIAAEEPNIATIEIPPVQAFRVPIAILTIGFAVAGLWIVAGAMADLRWAHRYRQQTGEGFAFLSAGLQLVGGGTVALAGACALLAVATRFTGRAKQVLLVSGLAVLAVLATSAVVALWVVGHGERCIGPCG